MTSNKEHKDYAVVNDKWMLVILYPALALLTIHIGNDNTLHELLQIPSYYTDVLLALACVYLLAFYYRVLFRKIDERFNWTDELKDRVKHHILYGLLLPVFCILAIEATYLVFLLDMPLHESSIFYLELPVIFVFCTLVNLVYAILYFRKHNLTLAQQLLLHVTADAKEKKEYTENFVVNNGSRSLIIPAKEVAYFMVIEKSTFLVTDKGQHYLYDNSLELLMKSVDQHLFFQINRQLVANRNSIKAFSPTDTRKLIISLKPETKEEVCVSKTKASTFLQWLKQD